MSTQNKRKAKSLAVNIDFMFSGCLISICYIDPQSAGLFPQGLVEYRSLVNRRSLKITRLKDKVWKTIIDENFTANPLKISEEEKLMVSILSDLDEFERELYSVVGNVACMWHNDATEDYAKAYLREFVNEHLEQVI